MNKTLVDKLIAGFPLLGYKEGGNSMVPLIHHKEPVDIHPANPALIEKGDIVIARVHGRVFCHLVTATEDDRVQISNNHGHVNGWTHRSKIYGIVTAVNGAIRPGAGDKIKTL